ncbi:MAG: hypothetical protein ABSF90_27115 [Syntrophobacteraceae bacterium]|jgi:hypothetical protein
MPRKGTIRPDVASSELAANRKSKSKARKTKVDGTQAQNQEVDNRKGENTMNVTQVEGQEVTTAAEGQEIPATIVESTEAEIFAEQTEGQEANTTAGETVVVVTQADALILKEGIEIADSKGAIRTCNLSVPSVPDLFVRYSGEDNNDLCDDEVFIGNVMKVLRELGYEGEDFSRAEMGRQDVNLVVLEGGGDFENWVKEKTKNQAAAPKPPKVSKRPYIALIEQQLELGNLDKKELLALIMKQHPEVNKNGASTFLTDALNPRYSHWKDRVVSKTADGKLIFADKIEPVPEAQPAEAQPEQPAE